MGAIQNPKVTMFFHYGTVGWSESHYYNTVVPVTDKGLYAAALALVQNRAICLDGSNAVIDAVRFSQDSINRDVAYLKRSDIPLGGDAGFALGPNGTAWVWQSPHLSWPIKIIDANQNQIAITYIAGMPGDANSTGPGPYDTSKAPGAGKYLDLYATYLVNGPWGASARNWPPGQFNASTASAGTAVPIYSPGSGANPPTITFKVATAGLIGGAPTVGAFIRAGGLTYHSPQSRLRLNGTYQVLAFDAASITVAVPRVLADPMFMTPGYFQSATYGVADYVGYVLDNQGHRKRGRPFSQPRGRAGAT